MRPSPVFAAAFVANLVYTAAGATIEADHFEEENVHSKSAFVQAQTQEQVEQAWSEDEDIVDGDAAVDETIESEQDEDLTPAGGIADEDTKLHAEALGEASGDEVVDEDEAVAESGANIEAGEDEEIAAGQSEGGVDEASWVEGTASFLEDISRESNRDEETVDEEDQALSEQENELVMAAFEATQERTDAARRARAEALAVRLRRAAARLDSAAVTAGGDASNDIAEVREKVARLLEEAEGHAKKQTDDSWKSALLGSLSGEEPTKPASLAAVAADTASAVVQAPAVATAPGTAQAPITGVAPGFTFPLPAEAVAPSAGGVLTMKAPPGSVPPATANAAVQAPGAAQALATALAGPKASAAQSNTGIDTAPGQALSAEHARSSMAQQQMAMNVLGAAVDAEGKMRCAACAEEPHKGAELKMDTVVKPLMDLIVHLRQKAAQRRPSPCHTVTVCDGVPKAAAPTGTALPGMSSPKLGAAPAAITLPGAPTPVAAPAMAIAPATATAPGFATAPAVATAPGFATAPAVATAPGFATAPAVATAPGFATAPAVATAPGFATAPAVATAFGALPR
eukprot:TRINITY_DN8267_c0_g1_i5.p1 TRINITY_DN8267_c0_g1~~TRINITY_DN8267_c0_g1_i5.p1  ORF type:complete len:572 (-),score=142.08 TRINITY_DN8267_c0_g1_i5:279-1994(-)